MSILYFHRMVKGVGNVITILYEFWPLLFMLPQLISYFVWNIAKYYMQMRACKLLNAHANF